MKIGYSEYVDIDVLLNRQGHICALCGKRINTTNNPNANEAKSIDHIIPLSLGGVHSYRNCQAVHRVCNSSKGNRAILDKTGQLVLCV